MLDVVSEELVIVTIYRYICRGSLPVVEDESALIRPNFNGSLRSSAATRRQEKRAKQGPTIAKGPRRKTVHSNALSKRKQLINRANVYDE